MSFAAQCIMERYLENVVDRLSRELNEDRSEVNDLFMGHVSILLMLHVPVEISIEEAINRTREHFKSVQKLRKYAKEAR